MNKEKLKKGASIALVIALGLALAITYFFIIYKGDMLSQTINTVATIMRPFIAGGIMAYIMKSTCNMYEKGLLKLYLKSKKSNEFKAKKSANVVAVVLTYITWLILFSILMWIIIPQIISSVTGFVQNTVKNFPVYIDTVKSWLAQFEDTHPEIAEYAYSILNTAKDTLLEQIDISQIGLGVLNGLIDTVNIVKDIAIGLILSVFFLSGRKVFAIKGKMLLHCLFKDKTANAIISEFKYADKMFGGFLEGKIIVSTVAGIIYYFAMLIMGIPYAALIAVICGVTNIIPFFGPFIGAVPSGLIILMSADNPIKVVWFIIFVCIYQFIDGNIVEPHIVGSSIKLSPFCVIFAVILFGGIWGFWGLIIGVPTFAVIYDIVKRIVISKLNKSGKLEMLHEYIREYKTQNPSNTVAVTANAQGNGDTGISEPDTSKEKAENGSDEQA